MGYTRVPRADGHHPTIMKSYGTAQRFCTRGTASPVHGFVRVTEAGAARFYLPREMLPSSPITSPRSRYHSPAIPTSSTTTWTPVKTETRYLALLLSMEARSLGSPPGFTWQPTVACPMKAMVAVYSSR